MSPRRELLIALLLGVAVRIPFWLEALRTPVDGDGAVVGLMAQHVGEGTTFWGTSYMSPLEAWLAAPLVAALGPTETPIRLLYFLLGLVLIPLAYFLAGAIGPRAAFPAALLMACPSPYFLLMAALPPEIYPTILILCAVLLLITLHSNGRLAERPVRWAALWGGLAGLALWMHLLTASVVAVCAAYLAVRTRRGWLWLAVACLPLLVASAPWWTRALLDRRTFAVVSVSSRDETLLGHLGQILPQMHRPVGGILGTHVPVIPDDRDHVVETPAPAAALLVIAYGCVLLWTLRAGRSNPEVLLLLAAALAPVLAFPLPLRSSPEAIRYLTPIYLPLLALVAWTIEALAGRGRALGVVAVVAALHLSGGLCLLEAWRQTDRTQPPFLRPDLLPVRQFLEARGIRRAYASYAPAYRLTYESGERLIVSQPWNERFPDDPLPYLDEVRFAKNVAWILTPDLPSHLPSRERFEAALTAAGGTWRRDEVGSAVVYSDFHPPFGPTVVPLSSAGPAGDGDLATRLVEPSKGPSTYRLPSAVALQAVTLVAPHGELRLLKNMDVAVSADGASFDVVAERRHVREYRDLRWVNGHPQYVIDDDLVAVPLAGRSVAAIRITPIGSSQAWAIGEILLHHTAEGGQSGEWDEWLAPDLTWPERRRALADSPRRDREDWYYRSLLAERRR